MRRQSLLFASASVATIVLLGATVAAPLPPLPAGAVVDLHRNQPDCYDSAQWIAVGSVSCGPNGVLRLEGGVAAISSRATFTQGVAQVRAVGTDAYGASYNFGWSTFTPEDPCPHAGANLWACAEGIVVSMNAFGPEGDHRNIGLRVQTGGNFEHRIIEVDDNVVHDYSLVWLDGRVIFLVDLVEKANLPAPTPEGPLHFVHQASGWVNPSVADIEVTIVAG